jgi:phenylpyruvate tautomerase PptA (4-oxalocrotonate tautomerase family)
MPMIDLTMPKGALSKQTKTDLMETLTDTLLKWEGATPDNKEDLNYEGLMTIAWTFLHEPELATVGGKPVDEPRYRVVVGVPQGSLGDEEKQGMVEEVTEQVLRAESPDREPTPKDRTRVWVIVNEITEGNWGGFGRIFRLEDILTFAGASEEDIEVRKARLPEQVKV